jgi:CheY-like chemotaxis protein
VKSVPSVLIVDAFPESRDVLRILLERHGVRAIEARHPQEAIRLAGEFRPDLVVLDAETEARAAGQAVDELRRAAGRYDLPIVILGKIQALSPSSPDDQIVAKPYHYGPLIRKIDGLLDAA